MRLPFTIPPADSRPFDIVGFGENSVDLLAVVAEYPASNSKQRLQRFARLPGGQIATAMAACARLGVRTRYVGRFGADDLGRFAADSLSACGVDISAAPSVAGATNRFAIILVDARTGERTVLWDRHPALSMEAKDVPFGVVTSGRILLLDCCDVSAAIEAARAAREASTVVVVDVEKVRPGLGDLLRQVDMIIAAQELPSALTGHDDLGRAIEVMAREFEAAAVCVTLGAEGSLTWCNGREIRTPGYQIDCVDSTGAGDVFRGAFAAACLRNPSGELEDALAFANAAGALNCRALGAQGALPTTEEVENFYL